jgi:3-dehydroquinate dehydratase/shikimate dehydrogenase
MRIQALQPALRIITICRRMTEPSMNYAARTLRLRIPRICVTIIADDAAEMMEKAELVLRENLLLELRLDYLKSPISSISKLRRLAEARPDAILIGTCRRKAPGGNFAGTLHEQIEVLRKASEAGCLALDVDIESAEAMRSEDYEELRSRAAVVLSSHDFQGTTQLEETFARMRRFTADFYKVVGTATCLHDNVVMTRFLHEHCQEYAMVGMCMGEQGTLSRILGIRAGGAFTFGAEAAGRETAPGQPTYRELRDFYRILQVETVTKTYGIAGDPISHSMSPWIMNTAFRRENVNAVYLPLHAKTTTDLLDTIRDLPMDGVSVTMPYKEALVPHLSNSDAVTQQTRACNTLVRGKDGRLFGFNTDVHGIVAAIEARMPLKGAKVLVLGAGGAARAAVFGLRAKGAEVAILNRTRAKAQELAKAANASTIKRSEVAKQAFDLILNATPLGMASSPESPLEEHELNTLWVFDSVYNPIETRLLKMAQAKGCGTISGVEMFLLQAARQFEIWTGKPAPIDAMRQVVLRQLGAGGGEGAEPVQTVVAPKVKPAAIAPAVEEQPDKSTVETPAAAEEKTGTRAAAASAKTGRKTAAKSTSSKAASPKAPSPKATGKAKPKAAPRSAAKAPASKAASKAGSKADSKTAKAPSAKSRKPAPAKPAKNAKAASKPAKTAAKPKSKAPAKKAAAKKSGKQVAKPAAKKKSAKSKGR